MNKSVLILCGALSVSVAIAVLLGRDLQRERARADALAERLLEFEPLERSDGPISTGAEVKRQSKVSAIARAAVDSTVEQPASTDAPEQVRSAMEYQGTLRTRQQVHRLQAALAEGTPLQEYQLQPLISAIDHVRSEIEQERADEDAEVGGVNPEEHAEANDRIVQVASDILFESQLEEFIDLLERELKATKMGYSDPERK